MQVKPQHYAQAWYESLREVDKSSWPQVSTNFMKRLQDEGNLNWLRKIVILIEELELVEKGITSVKVTTAHELPSSAVKEIVEQLVDSKELAIEVTEDTTLLGGLEVRTKDHRWDISMKGQLNQLKKSLL